MEGHDYIYAIPQKKDINMMKQRLSPKQLVVLDSLAINGAQNIQEIQLREGMNYATTHRSVKVLDRFSFIWMSEHDETRGPKGAQKYSLTPLGVVEALLRGSVENQIDQVVKNWGEISPRYIHHWTDFTYTGLANQLQRYLKWMYPERVILNKILPLEEHEILRPYIQQPNFEAIRDGMDRDLLTAYFKDPSPPETDPFIRIISSDSEYLRVWSFWFLIETNKYNSLQKLNEKIRQIAKVEPGEGFEPP
jgi:hypothetical protein